MNVHLSSETFRWLEPSTRIGRKSATWKIWGPLLLNVLLFGAMRLWSLTDFCLWGDEIFSLHLAKESWAALLASSANDMVHPPLFYLALKLWAGLGGDSLLWVRMFSVVLGLASIIPFCLLCWELKLPAAVMNLALALISVNAYLIHYAQEVRMYSLLVFFSLMSLWLFAKLLRTGPDRKSSIALFVANLALIYTDYYGAFVIGSELLFILLFARRHRRSFGLQVLCIFAAFVPWAYAVGHLASIQGTGVNLGWNTRPGTADLVAYYVGLIGPLNYNKLPPQWHVLLRKLAILFFAVPTLIWVWRAHAASKPRQQRIFWMLALLAFVPALAAYCASQVLPQSIWGERCLIVSAVPFLMLVSIGIDSLKNKALRNSMASAAIAWAAFSGATTPETRIAWDTLVWQMSEFDLSKSEQINVYTVDRFTAWNVRYYLEQSHDTRFKVCEVENLSAATSGKENHFWIAYRKALWPLHQSASEILAENGYRTGSSITAGRGSNRVVLTPAYADPALSGNTSLGH